MVNIPKITTHTTATRKRRAPGVDFLDEEYRMLIAGPSGSGKTNTLMYMLRKPLVVYDEIYLYTPNTHQELIQDFQKIMQKYSQKFGCEILHVMNPDEILDTTEYPEGGRKIVIFDDLIAASNDVQKKILKHFIDGRHHLISPVYLSQSYHKTPVDVRLNCSHLIVYKPTMNRHRALIASENSFEPELFSRLNPFEFLFLDKTKETCMKNFDEPIRGASPSPRFARGSPEAHRAPLNLERLAPRAPYFKNFFILS